MPRSVKPKAKAGKKESPAEERQRRIAEAAYFLAEQRGFAPGHEWEDWFQAESGLFGPASAPITKPKRAYLRRAANSKAPALA